MQVLPTYQKISKERITQMQLNKYCFSVIAAAAMVMSAQAVITESEPNNDSSTATTITRGATPWSDNGQVEFNPAGDNDWFKIDLTVGETLIVQTTPLIDDFDPDTVMAIVDPSGTTVLTSDDDGGPGFGSRVVFNAPSTGTYYVAITGYHGGGQSALSYYTGAHSEQGPYLIEASISAAPANAWNEGADGGGDAGKLPETAQSTAATQCARTIDAIIGNLDPSDADMFAIYISDPGAFSATTVGATSFDTQLWLFDANGNGVTFNDDSGGLQSTITGQFITGPGTYYIAISSYDHDAAGCNGGEIWADTPFGVERAPDGPGAANPVASWGGTTAAGGAYTIAMQGAFFVDEAGCDEGPPCPEADVDGDCCVNDSDLLIVLFSFGDFGFDLPGDINGDFVVNDADLLLVLFSFGEGCE